MTRKVCQHITDRLISNIWPRAYIGPAAVGCGGEVALFESIPSPLDCNLHFLTKVSNIEEPSTQVVCVFCGKIAWLQRQSGELRTYGNARARRGLGVDIVKPIRPCGSGLKMGIRAGTTKKSAASSAPVVRTRPAEKVKSRKRRPEEVKARILASAVDLFSTYGFRGVATHTIAAAAHVSLSLLLYHFGSKEALWKAMATEMIQNDSSATPGSEQDDPSLSASEKLRQKIVRLVHRFASTPALHRLMTLEGHQPSDRLLWLCDTYIAKEFNAVVKLIVEGQKDGRVRSANPARLRYAIIAFAAVPFSMSAEYQYLTKRNPFSSNEIESTIAFINKFVFID